MRDSAGDQPDHRADHADPQQHGNFSDGGDAPVQQRDQQHDHCAGNGFLLVRCKRMQVAGVLRKADGSRGNHQRRLNQRLPHEEERHQAAPFAGTVSFAQEKRSCRRRAAARRPTPTRQIHRAERGRLQRPRQQRLRPAHGANHQRAHHEGPDADHVDHVESDGFFEAQSALESGVVSIWLGRPGKLRRFVGAHGGLGIWRRLHRCAENNKWAAWLLRPFSRSEKLREDFGLNGELVSERDFS